MTRQSSTNVPNRRQFFGAIGAAGIAATTVPVVTAQPGNRRSVRNVAARRSFSFQRNLSVEDYDVVVLGGGPGGCGAAIAAGRLGAKVLLVEHGCMLGGMGTAGFVSSWYGMNNGEQVICRGLVQELLGSMNARGGLSPHLSPDAWKRGTATGFKPDALKIALDDFCAAADVEVRFGTTFVEAQMGSRNRLEGVIISNVEGMRYVRGKTFIDGTGDAKVVHACGLPYRQAGRDTEGIMPPTLCAVVYGVDFTRFNHTVKQEAVHRAIADGYFTLPNRHVPGIFRHGEDSGIMNAGHLFKTDATNTKSYSKALADGRKLVEEYGEFFRKYAAGCENMVVAVSASMLGIRESRRIVGEYELNYEDFKARRWFPDQIGIYHKAVDIHVYDTSDEQWERYVAEFQRTDRLARGESYGMPYGILVPKGMQNLWVAGRCNSSDIKVHGAIRDQPGCLMMGQAAGTAAVQSIRTGQPANNLNVKTLIELLREQDVYLPQEETTEKMTRS